jgi:hypothetical protein
MKRQTLSLMFAVTLGLALFTCHPAYAESTLSVLPTGNGSFILQGSGMEGVSAMDVTITYDAATLSNPQVTKGGLIPDALMGVNPTVLGAVRLGIVTTKPITGAGTVATLIFVEAGNSPGVITGIKANITDSKGKPLPVQAQVLNSLNEPQAAPASPPNAGTQPGVTAPPVLMPDAGRQAVTGGVVVPSEDSAATAKKEPAPAPEAMPEPSAEKAVVSQETVSSVTGTSLQAVKRTGQNIKVYSQKSVLDRFRAYRGERSVKAFTELFNQEPLIGFNQDPPIALSNGKATIKVSFIAVPVGKEKPDVKAAGVVLLSLQKDPDNTNTWIAELRPDKKAISATLIVDQEKVHMVFPIVVAPDVNIDFDKSGKVTEIDFKLFLMDLSPAHKMQFDLNNDGKRDYVDDYIFTANYIVKKTTETKPLTNMKLK